MNTGDGEEREKEREGGQVHLNVILIRRPLPLLINKIRIIGKVVVARSRPLGYVRVFHRRPHSEFRTQGRC